jgi:hypothetical protein
MRKAILVVAVFVVGSIAGCGTKTATVSGEASYDGQPIEDGNITFLPEDGQSAIAGGPIRNGKYHIENVPPGVKVVKIEAVKAISFARSSEEMAKLQEAAKAKGNATGIIDPADIIPPNAEGNNTKIELRIGNQTHHFHLKKPGG